MKELIENNYNIVIKKIKVGENIIIISTVDEVLYCKSVEDINVLKQIYPYVQLFCSIKNTISGEKYFEYELKKYILYQIYNINDNYNVDNILITPYKNVNSRIWESKIDNYYELIRMNRFEDNKVKKIVIYCISVVESILNVYNKIIVNINNIRFCINHHRMFYPVINMFYYDPTNMIIDHIGRDIVEYIKLYPGKKKDKIDIINKFIKKNNLNELEVILVKIRTLYPSELLDCIDEYLCDKKEKKDIIMAYKEYKEMLTLYKMLCSEHKKTDFKYEISWLL